MGIARSEVMCLFVYCFFWVGLFGWLVWLVCLFGWSVWLVVSLFCSCCSICLFVRFMFRQVFLGVLFQTTREANERSSGLPFARLVGLGPDDSTDLARAPTFVRELAAP